MLLRVPDKRTLPSFGARSRPRQTRPVKMRNGPRRREGIKNLPGTAGRCAAGVTVSSSEVKRKD